MYFTLETVQYICKIKSKSTREMFNFTKYKGKVQQRYFKGIFKVKSKTEPVC